MRKSWLSFSNDTWLIIEQCMQDSQIQPNNAIQNGKLDTDMVKNTRH